MRRISSVVAASAALASSVFFTRPAEALVVPKDSATFASKYEMDNSDTRLTATGGTDWSHAGSSGTLAGGFLSYNTTPGADSYWQAMPAIWDNIANKHINGWTIETRVKVISSTDGAAATGPEASPPARDRGFAMVPSDSAGNPGTTADVEVGPGNTWTPVFGGTHLDANSNSDDYHTFRIAYDYNPLNPSANQYLVWRDGVSLLEYGSPQHTALGFLSNAFYFGDGTGAYDGNVSIDYMRFDLTGAYSPAALSLPEPAALGTLAIFGLVARRRR